MMPVLRQASDLPRGRVRQQRPPVLSSWRWPLLMSCVVLGAFGMSLSMFGDGPAATTTPHDAPAPTVAAAGINSAPVAVALLPTPAAPPAGEVAGAADVDLQTALDLAATNPSAAAILLARVAVNGSDRAAYYLGQLHETGDGVAFDLVLARNWYRRAARSLPEAKARELQLADFVASGDLTTPRALLAGRNGERLDLVWQGSGTARGYRVDLRNAGGEIVGLRQVPIPAVSIKAPDDVTAWRVTALGAGDDAASSGWIRVQR